MLGARWMHCFRNNMLSILVHKRLRLSLALVLVPILVALLFVPATVLAQGEEVRFGYSVDEVNISATALSPQGDNYSFNWYINSTSSDGPADLTGESISFNADNFRSVSGPSVSVTLAVIAEDNRLVGEKSTSIPTLAGRSESDSDGDGQIDTNDPCPNDPDDTCDDSPDIGDDDDDDSSSDTGGDGDTGGLVNCGNPGADGVLQESEMCDFDSFVGLIDTVIQWLIGILATVAALLFMYGGFLYLTAFGDTSQVDEAKEIFQYAGGGFLLVLLAFTLIATIVNLLTKEGWPGEEWDQAIPIELSLDEVPYNDIKT